MTKPEGENGEREEEQGIHGDRLTATAQLEAEGGKCPHCFGSIWPRKSSIPGHVCSCLSDDIPTITQPVFFNDHPPSSQRNSGPRIPLKTTHSGDRELIPGSEPPTWCWTKHFCMHLAFFYIFLFCFWGGLTTALPMCFTV